MRQHYSVRLLRCPLGFREAPEPDGPCKFQHRRGVRVVGVRAGLLILDRMDSAKPRVVCAQ